MTASSGHAQKRDTDQSVALVVELSAEDPQHHALAEGVIAGVKDRWKWALPGIAPEEALQCGGNDTCFLKLTEKVGATHLLIIATAPLDDTQMVASIRAYRVRDGAEVYTAGELIATDGDARKDGAELLGLPLSRARGMPSNGAPPPTTSEVQEDSSGSFPSPVTMVGFGVMGAGVIAGAGIGAAAAFGLLDSASGIESELLTAIAATTAVVGVAVGVGVVTVGAVIE